MGELENPDAEISIGSPLCSDRVVVHINREGERIADVRFKAYGCATAIATASIFSDYIRGKTVQELAAMPENERNMMLGELEPSQRHCLDILHDLFTKVQEAQ